MSYDLKYVIPQGVLAFCMVIINVIAPHLPPGWTDYALWAVSGVFSLLGSILEYMALTKAQEMTPFDQQRTNAGIACYFIYGSCMAYVAVVPVSLSSMQWDAEGLSLVVVGLIAAVADGVLLATKNSGLRVALERNRDNPALQQAQGSFRFGFAAHVLIVSSTLKIFSLIFEGIFSWLATLISAFLITMFYAQGVIGPVIVCCGLIGVASFGQRVGLPAFAAHCLQFMSVIVDIREQFLEREAFEKKALIQIIVKGLADMLFACPALLFIQGRALMVVPMVLGTILRGITEIIRFQRFSKYWGQAGAV